MKLQTNSASSLLIFVVVISTGLPVRAQEDGFDLRYLKVYPCREMSLESANVSLYWSDILAVQANLSSCSSSMNISQYNGFRMHATSDANSSFPVIFIARQNSDGPLSFSIPLQPEGYSFTFNNVSRTLCPTTVDESSSAPLFYIDVFTSSKDPLEYNVLIEPVDNFTLEVNTVYKTTITPASPQIFYFKMPDGVDVVSVHVATESNRCAIASVQNKTCPVNDLLENARSKGIYQTMSKSAVLTVEAHQVKDREFLLVLIDTHYSVCHDTDRRPSDELYEQELNITIKAVKPVSGYASAFVLPFVIFLILPYSLTFIILFGCCPKLRCVPLWDCKHPLKKPCKCVGVSCFGFTYKKDDDEEAVPLTNGNGHTAVKTYNTMETRTPSLAPTSQDPAEHQLNGDSEKVSVPKGLEDSDTFAISLKYETDEGKMVVPRMSKLDYQQLHKRYAVYGWNAITVGIFYALPAFQLVLSEQRVLNFSGDQDQCYYNFKCTHPFGVFSAFNNVFSNIGYVLLGILFILVVLVRQVSYNRKRDNDKQYVQTHGLPQFFGIYYAMGIALILEGFMSSFYHICPNDANFQFDTAFMFIIGGLLLVKVFQKRHPDIHANAFIAFFSFAVIIVCTLIGIYFSRKDPIGTRLPIFAVILLLLVVFFISFYYYHHWKWRYLWKNFMEMVRYLIPHKDCKGPIHKIRFGKLCTALIINVVLAIAAAAAYKPLDIATAILAFFLVNLILFLLMYVASKIWFKEPLTWLALLLPFAIAGVWGVAFYFFMGVSVTNWSATPAESRADNRDCSLLDFYDNHDIWHFLSAFGMFFAFLFVLVLDDGVDDIERNKLRIF